MVVGSATFTGDLAARLGLDNVYGNHVSRYPNVNVEDLAACRADMVVLPDEPYAFSPDDGPEMFRRQRVALVEGRSLTWYGPSLVTARDLLKRAARQCPTALPSLVTVDNVTREHSPGAIRSLLSQIGTYFLR